MSTSAPARPSWFRRTWTQAVILGLASFCSPGIWGAMANAGAGGLQSAQTGNATTAATFCLMVVTALLGPALLGKLGPRWTLVIGTLGYAPYAAGLYANSKFGNQWFVVLGAALCGLTAGIFWAAEGSTIVAYPEPHRRGKAIAIWFSINQFGSVIGGCINLGLNAKGDKRGGLAVNTYAVFIAIQCVSPLVASLLSNPEELQRKDGVVPQLPRNPRGFWREVLDTLKLWGHPRHWVFAVPFFMSQWGTGTTSSYLANYFTVRARALTTLVGALLNQTVIWAFGRYLDSTRTSVRFRSYTSAAVIGSLYTATWIWFFVNQYHFYHADAAPTFDWNSPGFANAWIPILAQSLLGQILYNWLYWVLAHIAVGADQSRQVASFRSIESAASALSYGLGGANLSPVNLSGVNIAVVVLSLYPLYLLVQYVSDREEAGLNELDGAGKDGEEVIGPVLTGVDSEEAGTPVPEKTLPLGKA